MRNQGFSLLEVLVGSVIMLLGVTGFVTLHSNYIRLDGSLNMRQQALYLAQEKLQDLQHFAGLQSQPGVPAYNDIVTDGGGSIAPGKVQVALSTDPEHVMQFSRHWQVTNRYFVDSDNDQMADSWLAQGAADLPENLPAIASQKYVVLNVSWQGYAGEQLEVNLGSYLTPISVGRGGHIDNLALGSQPAPEVVFDSEQQSENLSFSLSPQQLTQASSPHLLLNGEQVRVKFEQTKFAMQAPTPIQQEKHSVLMVSCQCALANSAAGKTAAMITLVGDELVTKPGQWVTKLVGVERALAQSAQCTQCCRDHHDTPGMVKAENFYRLENGAAHQHYDRQTDGTYRLAQQAGDAYQEICHFQRKDGFYQLFTDWQLLAVTEFPPDYLNNPAMRNSYTRFIKQKIVSSLAGDNQVVALPVRQLNGRLTDYQLVAHGLYMQRMTRANQSSLHNLIAQDSPNWLALVPFSDLNITLLADWTSANAGVVSVTSQVLQTIQNPQQNYYADYSRGLARGQGAGNSLISAGIASGNAGMVGGYPLSPYEATRLIYGDGVSVTISP